MREMKDSGIECIGEFLKLEEELGGSQGEIFG